MSSDEARLDEIDKIAASNAKAIQSLGNDTKEKIDRLLTILEKLTNITEAVSVQYQSPIERQQEIILQMQELIARLVKIDENQEKRLDRLEAAIERMGRASK
jgi:ATP phosphoribosyltransferase